MSDKQEPPYTGPDQRREIRRVKADRRNDIRFEPDKEDRRKDPGRRKGDLKNNIWRLHEL